MTARALLFLLVLCGCPTAEDADATPLPLIAATDGVLVDLADDVRAIQARVLPVPANADPDRVLAIRVDGYPELDGAEALDARFVAGGVVVLGADHVLRFYTQPGAAPVALDDQVEPPLAVGGVHVAYARGEMPFFEIARVDVTTGGIEALTSGLAPCWSPALTPDGARAAFACSHEGETRLFLHEGQPQLMPRARFPTGPSAPRFDGERLAFTDEEGAAVVELRTGALLATDREAGAVLDLGGRFVVTGVDGALRPLEVSR